MMTGTGSGHQQYLVYRHSPYCGAYEHRDVEIIQRAMAHLGLRVVRTTTRTYSAATTSAGAPVEVYVPLTPGLPERMHQALLCAQAEVGGSCWFTVDLVED